MSEQEEGFTEEQAAQMLREYAESKQNQHTFFKDVVKTKDTTKVGNLSDEELGEPYLEVRALKDLEIFSREICDDNGWADYFKKQAEQVLATSLSRDAMLLKLSVTSTKQLADISPKSKKQNKGWFKSK
jgi:hypothetical protein